MFSQTCFYALIDSACSCHVSCHLDISTVVSTTTKNKGSKYPSD